MSYPTLSIAPLVHGFIQGSAVDPVMRSSKEGGYVKTWLRFTRIPKVFKLVYPPVMTDTDVTSMMAWESTTGYGADYDTWTHPITSASHTVRLAGPIQYKTGARDGLWQFEVVLEEV